MSNKSDQETTISHTQTVAEVEIPAGTVLVVKVWKEFPMESGMYVLQKQVYDIYVNNELVQPNHDADGAIRVLSHYMHGLAHGLSQKRKRK